LVPYTLSSKNKKPYMANDIPSVNEITRSNKFLAGLLLITLTVAAIVLIIAYWPDKMPDINKGDDAAWYTNKLFNITLVTPCNGGYSCDSLQKKRDSIEAKIKQVKDTVLKYSDTSIIKTDSALVKKWNDSLHKLVSRGLDISDNDMKEIHKDHIHLNTILLLLVALMGFLGNMIHIATSFTTFVGNGTFKRSWVLWYFVKPFTAAGLAIIVYFVIRAGFLSYGAGASGVSLYGILSLAAFAGLFTDSATLKLKEVFEVIFKPKDDRKDKLEDNSFSVTLLSPEAIPSAVQSAITISGKNLNQPDIKVTIDGAPVIVSKTADKIEFKYLPTALAIAAGKAILLITDKTGKTLFTKEIIINK